MIRLLLLVLNILTITITLSFQRQYQHRLRHVKLYNEKNPTSGEYDFNQWKKAFVTQPEEFSYTIPYTDIVGSIPQDLRGSLYRAMPGMFERGDKIYGHYLDGDGYIIKLTISTNGEVSFKSKYVKTKEYQEETKAGKVLYRSTFRTQRDANIIANTICLNNAFDLKLKNGANTNVVFWKNKLRVLFEAGVPHKLDPYTLETIGEDDLGLGKQLKSGMSVLIPGLRAIFPELHDNIFGSAFTAHPKIDPINKRLIGWTWRAKVSSPLDSQPQMYFHEWNKDLEEEVPTISHTCTSTFVSPHDFSFTENYYVFIENRVEGNTIPYLFGKSCPAECVSIVPSKSMVLNIVNRPKSNEDRPKANEDLKGKFRTVPLLPGFTIHSVCAFEEGNSVCLLTTAWSTEEVASGTVKGGLLGAWEGTAPHFDNIPKTLLYKTIVDVSTGELISHAPQDKMENMIIEHPHINPEYESKKVRFVWMSVGSLEGISSPPLGYLKLDLETKNTQIWMAPIHNYCEELVIVPKSNSINEDDVYLIATIFSAPDNKSRIAIFDGKDILQGPVAEIPLKHHLPHSLHGCFEKSIL